MFKYDMNTENELYAIRLIINKKTVQDFIRNNMIYSVAAMPGMNRVHLGILIELGLDTPWNLYTKYKCINRIRSVSSTTLCRIRKFSHYLNLHGIKDSSYISIIMEAKHEYISYLDLVKRDVWILPFHIMNDYF